MLHNKHLQLQAQQVIMNVLHYFELERDNGGTSVMQVIIFTLRRCRGNMEQPYEDDPPDRILRRGALTPVITNVAVTPENKISTAALDEFIIQQRGRRCKPITWSPIDYSKADLLRPNRDVTPDRITRGIEINSKLRRRLIMSPDRNRTSKLGNTIAKKLKVSSCLNNAEKMESVVS
ncbi:hypothetical protein FQA39_LY12186 [Lamprigera yunnana]|nr:hypothetical protein FQA39_LY12186 [Lamprigera yunnana]